MMIIMGGDAGTNTPGSQESSLYCAATGHCVYNSFNSHIGCCDDGTTVCPVWTTCYDSTDNNRFTTANGLTLWWYVLLDLLLPSLPPQEARLTPCP